MNPIGKTLSPICFIRNPNKAAVTIVNNLKIPVIFAAVLALPMWAEIIKRGNVKLVGIYKINVNSMKKIINQTSPVNLNFVFGLFKSLLT